MEMMESDSDLDLELERLKSRLKQTRDKAAFWTSDEITTLASEKSRAHKESLEELQDQKEKYQALLTTKKENALLSDRELEEKCSQLENLKKELERLCALTQELHGVRAEEEKKVSAVKQDIDQLKKDIAAPTKARQKLEYLNKASSIFSSMLGQTFKKTTGNRIQVIFTQIDEKDPLMPFYFFLHLQGAGRKYVVSDPQPAVEGLEELVTELNRTNNIRQFMIAIRNKFKNTLS